MSKATPRPWEVVNHNLGDGWRISAGDKYIADVYGESANRDAAHIVKCVNMHDELMELINYLGDGEERNPNIYIAMDKAMRICDRLRKVARATEPEDKNIVRLDVLNGTITND